MAHGSIDLLKTVPNHAVKTYDIGATNLTVAASPILTFTVTGMVLIEFLGGFCRESLVGATATLEVGVVGDTAGLIAQTTATDIDLDDVWVDATPTAAVDIVVVNKLVSANVVLTVGTATVTDGLLDIVCLWRPMSNRAQLSG